MLPSSSLLLSMHVEQST
uniref:Uncharacterized protein n=1 Tax=Arundo donax TaxID=35708 RepID=A0A0A9AR66_ARUDO